MNEIPDPTPGQSMNFTVGTIRYLLEWDDSRWRLHRHHFADKWTLIGHVEQTDAGFLFRDRRPSPRTRTEAASFGEIAYRAL